MAVVIHLAVDWTEVAVRAKPSQAMPTLHTHSRLSKVKVILIGQLYDVVMTKE